MNADLGSSVGAALGARVVDSAPLAGGDIHEAYAVGLADGRRVFVKANRTAPKGMFGAEARGLAWLAEAHVLRVPRCLAVEEDPGGWSFLALELIEPGRRSGEFDEALGRGLACLHRAGAPSIGLDHDNYIGRLPQRNDSLASWPEFYGERRLRPQVALAGDRLPPEVRDEFDRLIERMESMSGPAEPPARLHGDLWSGNVHCDEAGAPCLIDPAAYGGHREIDLAMLQLFGAPSERFFCAYDEVYPLQPEWRQRVSLYQLYPLLVHVNLFGTSYVPGVCRALSALRGAY